MTSFWLNILCPFLRTRRKGLLVLVVWAHSLREYAQGINGFFWSKPHRNYNSIAAKYNLLLALSVCCSHLLLNIFSRTINALKIIELITHNTFR